MRKYLLNDTSLNRQLVWVGMKAVSVLIELLAFESITTPTHIFTEKAELIRYYCSL